mmetsp:Transcript_56041/g.114370  ORF Transcript_56041/g.114370 Transcript_56041/m.114370 type:complete len:512 (+) Transcript_56041:144-1679(+)
MSKLQELKEGLSKIKVLESELAGSKWNEDPSPKSISDFQGSLLKRYQESKSLYMQRRLESFVADHVSGFDEKKNRFEIPDYPCINKMEGSDDGETDRRPISSNDEAARALEEKHAKALTALETAAHGIHAALGNMKNSYETVISRRKELEKIVQDMEQGENNDDEDDPNIDGENDKDLDTTIEEHDIEVEREKTELLQQRKRQLQEEHTRLVKLKEERMKSMSHNRDELAALKEEESKIRTAGHDPSQFLAKIKELKEMKDFYDSLRDVVEELGGVKILDAREDSDTKHLFLALAFYENHRVEVELEVYCNTLLKLVSAKWLSSPVVTSVLLPISSDSGEPSSASASASSTSGSTDANQEIFSLPLDPLDDLVQTAKSSMGPPHDLRFVIRETCARIRIVQARADDLAVLRRRVLTKVVGNDQVVCSFNEGIVVVMRLYDQWVKVEQIVGISGWDQSLTDKIHAVVSKREESWTPNKVVDLVKKEIERLIAEDGFELPKTPVLPMRRKANK